MGKLGDISAIPALIRCLDCSDFYVREKAAESLGMLGISLKENPALGEELVHLMGGQQAVQQVIANNQSTIKDVSQESSGGGKQTVKADIQSKIQGVKQIKK